ncbi:MAG: hypothetical protein AB7O84_04525 [Planctomycetota bacterium]
MHGFRKVLIRCAWGALIGASAMWAGLQVGRPLYYTDGQREVAAGALPHAGMWVWGTPSPLCELPGPVEGRIARLPDGRLLYGRGDDGRGTGGTELVLFDPAHPDALPEPAVALNSVGHDLAPAVAADGTVWFASDRPGGVGGYDLYRSRIVGSTFLPPVAVTACNTMLDETDPAPDPLGGAVFARIDREHRHGDDGVLFRWDGGDLDPVPLFGAPGKDRPVDRDPSFAPDGSALWFLRQDGPWCHLVRSGRLGAAFDPPVAVDGGWGAGAVRAPVQVDARQLLVLRPASADLPAMVLASAGREVLPWWTGQRWLEVLLVWVLLGAAALLLLLYLGQRWRSLDLVTLCLLLSLLVHLLLMLWLMGVEIAGTMVQGEDDGGAVEVTLIDGPVGSGGAGDAAQLESLAASARFEPAQRALDAAAPGAAVEAATRAEVAPQAPEWDGATDAVAAAAAAAAEAAPQGLQDERELAPQRAGTDAGAALSAAELAQVDARQQQASAARAAAAGDTFAVEVPAAPMARDTGARSGSRSVAAPQAELPAAETDSRSGLAAAVQPEAAVADAPGAAAARGGADATIATPLAATAMPAPAGSSATAERVEHGAASAASAPERPQAELQPSRAAAAPIAAAGTAVPVPQPQAARGSAPAALRDQPSAVPVAAAAGDARDDAVAAVQPAQPAPLAASNGDGSAGDAARSPSNGSAAPEQAAPTPGSALDRASAAGLAAGAAPQALPRARTGSRAGSPALVLRDGGAVAPVAVPGGAAASPAATAGRARLPGAALAALQQVATPASGTRAAATAGNAHGTRTADAPGSDLLAAERRTPPGGSGGGARPLPRARPRHAPGAAVRDGDSAMAAVPQPSSGRGERSGRGLVASLPPVQVAAARVQPSRPQRGLVARQVAIVPPGSLLSRAEATLQVASAMAPGALSSPYSNRFGPQKQQALEEFGGTADTERAVRDGLRYLASIQRDDGGWGSNEDYESKYGYVRVGKSALCLLAFLGAGHTPASRTEHSEVARRAVAFLLSVQQRETGAFGVSSAYGHGISTYALAECYGITKDERLRRPVEDALSWILANQGPRGDRRNRGGWGYFSPGLRPEDDYARTSISSWMVMALESAKLSGIAPPDDVLPAAREFFERAWDREQRFFRYNHMRSRLESGWPTLPASTPASAFCLLLLGVDRGDERIVQALDYTVDRRPRRYRRYSDDDFVLQGQGNVYFWYYGTLACFLAGGDAWKEWNERLSTLLPEAQELDGSWPPIDVYAQTAGDTQRDRAYTTAMCVLSLEVYYRYFTPLLLGR